MSNKTTVLFNNYRNFVGQPGKVVVTLAPLGEIGELEEMT